MQKKLSDPSHGIDERAKKAISPELDPIRSEVAELKKQLQEQQQERVREQYQASEREAFGVLADHVRAAADAPYTARYLAKKGGDKFYEFACAVARGLPIGSGPQAMVDAIEAELEGFADVYQDEPSNTTKPKHSAAAKATVSNRLASARTAVVEEEDLSAVPLDERVKRAMSALERD